jgi:subtilisin-like proprotein convertase family protein
MKTKILSLIAIFICTYSISQMTLTGPDFPQTAPLNCSAIIPTGGAGTNFIEGTGNYLPNMSDTLVLCPDLAQGSKVSVAFATNIGFEFDIHPTDTLYVFDGPNTSSPLLGAYNSGTNPNGFYVQASFLNNPSGCLTLVFHSNAASEGTGWVANIACGDLPQPFYPHIEAFKNGVGLNVLNPLDTGYVDVCLGDSILLIAKPLFPYSLENTNTGYSQNANNAQYQWTISGIGQFTNDSVWFTPPQRVGYYIDLRITDPFPLIERITCKVRVSQQPLFTGTGPLEDSVCFGGNTILIGGTTSTDTVGIDIPDGTFQIGGVFAGLTFLPDGSGQEYETNISISGFDSTALITGAADFDQLCLDIEHSYIGDLEILLTCPNGTSVSLMNAYNGAIGTIPGGCGSGIGTFLGNDTNLDGGAPGTPVVSYCFSPSLATLGTICAENAAGNTIPNAYGFNSMNPNGIYLPDGNFNDFIGCPVNGNWTITVRDNQGIDDGYIFQWGIYFNSSLYPESEGYANIVDTNWWSFDPTIISGLNGDTLIVVQPPQIGIYNYQFNVIDNFGCPYDTTVFFVVVEGPEIFPDTVTCNSTFQVSGTVSFDGGVWSSTDPEINFSNSTAENPLISASGPGTYTVSFLDNECSGSVTREIQFLSDIAVDIPNATVCAGNNYLIAPLYSSNGTLETADYTISWNNGSFDTTLIANEPGNYVITVSNACVTDADSILVYDQPTIFTDTLACNLLHQIVGTYAPNGGLWTSTNAEISFSNASIANPVVNAAMAGVYNVTLTDPICQTQLTAAIEFPPNLSISLFDTSICIGTNFNLIPVFNNVSPIQNGYVNPINLIWENNSTDPVRVINAAGIYTATVSNECYTNNSTSTVTLKPCDIEVPNIINLSSTVGNNLFFVQYNGIAEFNCMIFNRWGNLIYEYNDPAGTWDGKTADGKPVVEGTYFYKIVGRFDGLEEDFVKHGFVVVKY